MALEKVSTQKTRSRSLAHTRLFRSGLVRRYLKTALSYHLATISHVITAGQDYSNESAEVQAICAAVHTPEVIAAYVASQQEGGV
jgi:hypothetical protein